MAILSYNDITPKKVILHNDEPWLVVSSHVFRKQQRKPVNITKLKNLINGRLVEVTFHQNESVEEADIETRQVKYIFEKRDEYWFCDPDDPSDRFFLKEDVIGDAAKFMPANMVFDAMVFNDEIIGVEIPIKMDLKVKEAAPAVKGNTSSGATKEVVLESGAKIQVPLFINEGDIVRVNTETGDYAERVEKA